MRAETRGKGLPRLRQVLSAAVLGFGVVAASGSAQAQFWNGWGGGWGSGEWGGMSGGDIRASIAGQGFRVVAPLRRQGAVFVADVVDRRGQRERLIVAAADGQILQRFLLDDPRLPGYVPRTARALPHDPYETPADRADRGGLVPPANIPENGPRAYGDRGGYDEPAFGQREPGAGPQAYGGGGQDNDLVEPARPRPPLKVVKPKPHVVERTPDTVVPDRPILRKPLEPLAAPSGGEAAPKPSSPPPAVASAPNPAPAAAPAPAPMPAPAPATSTKRDPLAIPGGDGKSVAQPSTPTAARIIPGVTGAPAAVATPAPAPAVKAPAPKPAAPKANDVPVAPLD